ncbi:HlyD family secretion protein [Polymorphobacter arshaanensis]|uniref:HlyD family secretion protein n=1 Tax=Glacieibacterium arshaanense TaxID=2511025 RepID=A0A4Y9EPR2_9SPHN|nr:HlyD family secretion protein [Polymorphobacter arshaanensis]TFU05586.1 HlyD family secretion protein [Polymorphobacter arshaanensis]
MSETTEPDPAPAAQPDPVRRWTYIVAGLLLALLAYNIAADRLAPITYQTTAETLVVPVTPQVSGEILSVPVTDNSRVTKGQLLARIDPTNYRIALESARASYGAAQQSVGAAAAAVDSARAVLTSRKAQLVEAQQDNDRTAKLLEVGYATRAKLEATMAKLASAEAGVVQAEAQLAGALQQLGPTGSANPQLRAAVAAVDSARANLEWTKVTAPVDGYISNLQIGHGSYAKAGTPLISLIDVSRAGLIGYFTENQIGNVRLGDRVLIALDMFPGKLFTGKVVGLGGGISTPNQSAPTGSLVQAPSSSWLSSSQRLPIRIAFDPSGQVPPGLRLGSQASVMVETGDAGFMKTLNRWVLTLRSYLSYVS